MIATHWSQTVGFQWQLAARANRLTGMLSLLKIARLRQGGPLLCYVLAIGLAIYFWSPVLNAKWGLIDDHEIMFFIGTNERLPFSGIPSLFSSTELASDSTLARFRPSYYAFRAIEAMAWGKNPTLWYLFRIAIAMLLAVTLAHACLRFAGPALTFGFLVLALSSPYWADLFARAGPGETYAALGVCLVVLGLSTAEGKELGGLRAFLVSLGIVIAAGSKENFLVLGLLPLWLLLRKQPRTTPSGKLMLIGAIFFLAWIALTLLPRLRHAGTDMYANDASFLSRFKLLGSFLAEPTVIFWIVGLLLLPLAGALIRATTRNVPAGCAPLVPVPIRGYFVAGLCLLALYGFQFVFYAGRWPDEVSRYNFPAILSVQLSVLVGLVALVDVVRALGLPIQFIALTRALLATGLLIAGSATLERNREASFKTVRETKAFDERFKVVVDYLNANPTAPLIVNSHDVIDFEPIFSIQRFVRAGGLSNPLAVRIVGYTPGQFPADSHRRILADALVTTSQSGNDGLFVPLPAVSQINCFSIGLSGPFLQTCTGGGIDIWP